MDADRPLALVTGSARGIGADDGSSGTFTRDGEPLAW